MFPLNRMQITGLINEIDTPLSVLKEIALTHRVIEEYKYRTINDTLKSVDIISRMDSLELINLIYNTDVDIIFKNESNDKYSLEDMKKIGNFINPMEIWDHDLPKNSNSLYSNIIIKNNPISNSTLINPIDDATNNIASNLNLLNDGQTTNNYLSNNLSMYNNYDVYNYDEIDIYAPNEEDLDINENINENLNEDLYIPSEDDIYNSNYDTNYDLINNFINDVNIINNTNVNNIEKNNEKVKNDNDQNKVEVIDYDTINCDTIDCDMMDAFEFLKGYMLGNFNIPLNFEVGYQSKKNIRAINNCVLYRLCKKYHIQTTVNTTTTQMERAIKLLSMSESSLNDNLNRYFLKATKNNKINFLLNTNIFNNNNFNNNFDFNNNDFNNNKRNGVDYGMFDSIIGNFGNNDYLLGEIQPKNDTESIYLAAKLYKIDLSFASNPKEEYKSLVLSNNRENPGIYMPNDFDILQLYVLNPDILRIDVNFNPELPYLLYNKNDLKEMATICGYKSSDFQTEGLYELLQLSLLDMNFYFGHQFGIKNKYSPIYNYQIDAIDNGILICYGTKWARDNNLMAFRANELAFSFRNNKNFMNPIDNKTIFGQNAIKKLKNLCRKTFIGESEHNTKERLDLYHAIIETEIFVDDSKLKARNFLIYYQNADIIVKKWCKDVLNCLFDIAMMMRGWLGTGPYPITIAITEDKDFRKVEENVLVKILQLKELCEENKIIWNLPLMYYREEFVISADVGQGLTIGDRINIVETGDTGEITSCIRLSSNWLTYSSYYYIQLIGADLPFEVSNLRNIY